MILIKCVTIRIFITIIVLVFRPHVLVFGQSFGSVDLSIFCPNEKSQYKATCYAYAVAYSAMSTMYNIQNNIVDSNEINRTYFSPGVVASYHNNTLPPLKRSYKCGKFGTAKKALEILKTNGTTLSSDYDCDCKPLSKISKELKRSVKLYKISNYVNLAINNIYSTQSLNWIKDALNNKRPIIISVYQDTHMRNIKTSSIADSLPNKKTMSIVSNHRRYGLSNHVVTILGYKDDHVSGNGYFLIKNNYRKWGDGRGFSWVPYTYILPLVHEAYYIEHIQS